MTTIPAPVLTETPATSARGIPVLLVSFLGLLAAIAFAVVGGEADGPALGATMLVLALAALLAALVGFVGLTPVSPSEPRVLQLFGQYRGTVHETGLRWVNPLTTRKKVSTRLRNHETSVAKVNDADGNPIEIAAVVVWQVEDTARALFSVDDFVDFVATQAETAVRHIATSYPYDGATEGRRSLRENAGEITEQLSAEIAARVASSGVAVVESRLTRLAYAPEIAQAMLRRQQAGAVVAARQSIVTGAVGMVESALQLLSEREVVELDEERKAAMVSNLPTVLCSDQATQPIVNTGTLYNLAARMAERKGVLLRLDPAVHDALARWAAAELRSTNAQIEFLLRAALKDSGRLPDGVRAQRRPGRPRTDEGDGDAAEDGGAQI